MLYFIRSITNSTRMNTAEHLMARNQKTAMTRPFAELYRRHIPMPAWCHRQNHQTTMATSTTLSRGVSACLEPRAKTIRRKRGIALGWIVHDCPAPRHRQSTQKAGLFQGGGADAPGTCERGVPAHLRAGEFQRSERHLSRKLLSQLPAAQREALHLSYYCDMSHREIVASTGIPLGTIKTRLQLALRKIRASVLAFEDFKGWAPSQSTSV